MTVKFDETLSKKIGIHKFNTTALLAASKEASPFDVLPEFDSSTCSQVDLLVAYVYSLDEMKSIADCVEENHLLADNGQLFLIYPKNKNELGHTAIGRDTIFPYLYIDLDKEHYMRDTQFKFNRMLAIDANYTMMSLKNVVPSTKKKTSKVSQRVSDYVEHIADIEQLLSAHEHALNVYKGLTLGYQKEWARYVFSAKQDATRLKRQEEMVAILF